MHSLLYSGVLHLPWWGTVLAALALTHVTIASVTIFLHRHQAHRALELHPAASHFFRFWLWLTTGMVTREWAAVHRKHHAKCETPEDPHSPQVHGLNRVLWGGVFFYMREARQAQTLERYGHGTPDDWLERRLYSKHKILGIVLMGLADMALFGVVPGGLVLLVQIAWIPFWAAGVVNGIGHYWGYRNWPARDASTNIFPVGILIGGEELHNNHHAFPASAKLSNRWFEFDIGWLYIRVLQALGLAKVKHVAPVPRLVAPKANIDLATVQAVIRCHYDVLSNYTRSLKKACVAELDRLRRMSPEAARALKTVKPWLGKDQALLGPSRYRQVVQALNASQALATMYSMRGELTALWSRSTSTGDQLARQLQDWCQRAEASGIVPLVDFSRRLRSYA
ncbi:fatty acid desaturase [Variovorax sp. NFACC27]|uniref:Acyl-CoA desaturase n=1 Tax=Variovorax gossypii TaxID=1679495 RepID=A0A3S0QAH8_9BURK|nr:MULTISPECIES: fatty acid desaturase [Variovorax]MDP9602672.1 stearoyl-CoA desaturase (delta-9 desaturase) [Variovorax paradoxus]SEF20972.1 stearoyl-CoA desaturase (delta-9 desaturase) [Variovorax sp. NFACC28]SEF50698.1 stearoyl-CoA desaturase (delta-9 desaturase) [Variovorax sp. NFACC29]SFB68122.1 stearoyl-CoA desaturase (delta-9 desaturase) [Variovorax sp. NFACC26]SFG49670.1 stearoyl-CoA desaturase (delta-9 desaturase) [Variovorax sp. NFACC27]